MQTFPYTDLADAPAEGAEVSCDFPVDIVGEGSDTDTGVEQRNALSVFPRHSVTVAWDRDANSEERVNTLWAFYNSTRGPLLPFVYFDFNPGRSWPGLYVGVGNGSALAFDAPVLSWSSAAVSVNGVVKTPGTHYALAPGAGANGRARLTFTAGNAPADKSIVTISFTGRAAFVMRFPRTFSYRLFSAALYSTGITLREVKGES